MPSIRDLPDLPAVIPALRLLQSWYRYQPDGGVFRIILGDRLVSDSILAGCKAELETQCADPTREPEDCSSRELLRIGRQVERMLREYAELQRLMLVRGYHDTEWQACLAPDVPGQKRSDPVDVEQILYEDGGYSVTIEPGGFLWVNHAGGKDGISIRLPEVFDVHRRYAAAVGLLTPQQLAQLERDLKRED